MEDWLNQSLPNPNWNRLDSMVSHFTITLILYSTYPVV